MQVAATEATSIAKDVLIGVPARGLHIVLQRNRNNLSIESLEAHRDEIQALISDFEATHGNSPDDLMALEPLRSTLLTVNDYINRYQNPTLKKKALKVFRPDQTAERIGEQEADISTAVNDTMLLLLNRVFMTLKRHESETKTKLESMNSSITSIHTGVQTLITKLDAFNAADKNTAGDIEQKVSAEVHRCLYSLKAEVGRLEQLFAGELQKIKEEISAIRQTTERTHESALRIEHEQQISQQAIAANHAEALERFASLTGVSGEILVLLQAMSQASATPAELRSHLPEEPPCIIDREQLDDLKSQLPNDSGAIIYPRAIVGDGGVGKSTLALRFAHQRKAEAPAPYDLVYWLEMDESSKDASWRQLAERQKVSTEGQPLEGVIKKVYDHLGNRRFLLLFDNVGTDYSEIKPFFPDNPQEGQHVLCTLRNASGWPAERLVTIGLLGQENAQNYIRERLQKVNRAEEYDEDEARDLAERLGFLPLALYLAMGRICDEDLPMTVPQMLDNLSTNGLAALTDEQRQDPGQQKSAREAIDALWDPTCPAFSEDSDTTSPAKLMGYIGLMGADNIPYVILLKLCGGDIDLLNRNLVALARPNLITRKLEREIDTVEGAHGNLVSVHRLLQAVVCQKQTGWDRLGGNHEIDAMTVTGWITDWLVPLADALFEALPEDPGTAKDYAIMRYLAGHFEELHKFAIECAAHLHELPEDTLAKHRLAVATICLGLSRAWREAQNFHFAYQYASQVLEQNDDFPGKDMIHGHAHRVIGNLGADQGEYDLAIESYEEALRLYQASGETSRTFTARTYNALGWAYRQKADYEKAEQQYQAALSIYDSMQEEAPLSGRAETLNGLGRVYKKMDRTYDRALQYYESALQLRQRVFGEYHRQYSHTLHNMANVYVEQRKYLKALEVYERVLALDHANHGEQHSQVAITLNDMANACSGLAESLATDDARKAEYMEKATRLYQAGLDIFVHTYGEQHPDVATAHYNLGGMAVREGNLTKAANHYHATLHVRMNILGSQHPLSSSAYLKWLETTLSLVEKMQPGGTAQLTTIIDSEAVYTDDLPREECFGKIADYLGEMLEIIDNFIKDEKSLDTAERQLRYLIHILQPWQRNGRAISSASLPAEGLFNEGFRRALELNETLRKKRATKVPPSPDRNAGPVRSRTFPGLARASTLDDEEASYDSDAAEAELGEPQPTYYGASGSSAAEAESEEEEEEKAGLCMTDAGGGGPA